MTSSPGETDSSPPAAPATRDVNLTQRVLTGVILMPFVLLAVYLGGWWVAALVGVFATVGVLEFCALGRAKNIQGSGLIGVPAGILVIVAYQLREPLLWQVALLGAALGVIVLELIRNDHSFRRILVKMAVTLGALLYVAFPSAFLVAIRNFDDGLIWLLMILFLTWGTDSFAYLGGRLWGRRKLAPTISPKKTVEGAIVGVIGGFVSAAIVLALDRKLTVTTGILIAIGPFVAILGDLFESWLKRAFSIKDSHITGFDILPGHGGVLDRVDALILVAAVCYFFLQLTGLAYP